MGLSRADTQSIGLTRLAHGIQGAQNVQLAHSSINVVNGDSHTHTHIHYHAITDKLKAILDAVSNYRKIQQDTLAKATPGTILWLLECKEFRLFVDVDGILKILWGSGMPGAGKTVLASIVINKLEALAKESSGQICVGYVYIRYSDQDQVTIRGILEILVKQTVERHPDCVPICEQAYNCHLQEGTKPTEEELVTLLRLFNERFKATFYVLDALDEAPVRIRLKVIQKLSSLGARLFITSRPLPALEAKCPAAHAFPIQAQDQDLDLHIAEKISDSEDLQDLLDQGGSAFRERLISTVKSKCGGMFLHASLQLDALQDCFTAYDAIETLEAFPRKIEEVYQRTWNQIVQSDSPHHVSLAKAAFVWVLNAKHSMTIDLLRNALATCPKTYHYNSARLMPEATILAACRGLIAVDQESRLVRLVHYTAKEPLGCLLSDGLSHPQALLTAICVARLADCGFQNTTITSRQELDEALDTDLLLEYAYGAWAFHAEKSIHLDPTTSLVSTFVSGCSRFPVQQRTPYTPFNLSKPLHIVVFYNLPITLAGPQAIRDPNIPTGSYRMTPLHLACLQGHQGMVESLLRLPGVLVNARDMYGRTPLMVACEEGHEGIVVLFLARPNIGINARDKQGWTALMFASAHGHASVVKVLLTHSDIDVNLARRWGATALMFASGNGHTSVVELLLAVPGINVNAVVKDGNTAIKLAAEWGREDVVRVLLDAPGIVISIAGTSLWGYHTAMSIAIEKGYHGVVRLFQDFEARIVSM